MNAFDQFVKNKLKIKQYARYTDDFVIISSRRQYLENLLQPLQHFLSDQLALELHPKKITIRSLTQGIDFLGYVILPHYRQLRTKTKHRIVRKLKERVEQYRRGLISIDALHQSLQSYRGVLSHANTHQLKEELDNQYWFWLTE